ncbi:hypothetical protein Ocin01_12172 [Orchesella cincta]|uniref:Uncharacterized protein n=1 Tax=Orchesella cincta TaxID=48709 RepID=A0A1D2MN96_ORCCI|nr:hypothetical protein Ocin01_12172 [Orchesella cincta]
MNKLSFVLLGLLFVSAYAVPAADNVSESEKKVFQETVTVEEGIVTNAVTPLKSIFLPNMARVACWGLQLSMWRILLLQRWLSPVLCC